MEPISTTGRELKEQKVEIGPLRTANADGIQTPAQWACSLARWALYGYINLAKNWPRPGREPVKDFELALKG